MRKFVLLAAIAFASPALAVPVIVSDDTVQPEPPRTYDNVIRWNNTPPVIVSDDVVIEDLCELFDFDTPECDDDTARNKLLQSLDRRRRD